jgi:methylase of polypeptide subunit release factors
LPAEIEEWRWVDDFPRQVAQFKTVFWDPRDTESLRRLIRESSIVQGKTVLEIGTGTGLLSLCCVKSGAARVVATDVNPAAVANATYNASILGLADRLETRLSPLDRRGAYFTIGETERFDLIISNPPWENQTPGPINEYALYDQDFVLLRSMLSGLDKHLNPGGKAYFAYGCVDAIETLQRVAREFDLALRFLDDRSLQRLPEVFLPGMLLEIAPNSRQLAF